MPANRRIFYALQQVAIGDCGVTSFGASQLVHGAQSVGINTKFNLDQVFELGQVALYQNVEVIPDIEVTLEKVLDGYAPMWTLATQTATGPQLLARASNPTSLALSIFSDLQSSASGTALTTVYCSGIYPTQVGYNFPVEGNSTEQLTLIGSNKKWAAAGITFAGLATNTDVPSNPSGVSRRQHIVFAAGAMPVNGGGSNYTILPTDIEGISASGTNNTDANGNYLAHVQSIKTNANLNREALFELGRRGVYYRYASYPIEVKTDIEIIGLSGDSVTALEVGANADGTNLKNQHIAIKSSEGIYIDVGTNNKLASVSYGGGNAGTRGGNVTETYSYQTFNDFTVYHPADPAGFPGY